MSWKITPKRAVQKMGSTSDNSKTKDLLGWEPIETKRGLIEQGIVPAVQDFLN